jgi:hypothetical protein
VKERPAGLDPLFNLAEQQAADYSHFPQALGSRQAPLLGLLTPEEIERRIRELRALDVDSYVAAAVFPSEDPNRPGARWVIRRMRGEILREIDMGPLYAVEMLLERRLDARAPPARRRDHPSVCGPCNAGGDLH